MDNKVSHLQIIQAVIFRLAQNSFLIKGWTVAAIAAFVAISDQYKPSSFLLVYIPIVSFWFLDAYFVYQERLYRKLYDSVRLKIDSDIDFSMNAAIFKSEVPGILKTAFSPTLLCFHGVVFLLISFISLFF